MITGNLGVSFFFIGLFVYSLLLDNLRVGPQGL